MNVIPSSLTQYLLTVLTLLLVTIRDSRASRPEQDDMRFHHAAQNSTQFKTYELFLEFSV